MHCSLWRQAQITLDGSLGGQRGALPGPNYVIPSAVGSLRGSNLFHSFGQCNLANGESATFTGPTSIANIISRVTGGNPSVIDGTIRSQIPRANLFLLNPSGVLFGPNASLDVSGSFHVSTADYLRLADGAVFASHTSVPSTLSVAPPAAFGFLTPTPAPIGVLGSTLQVPTGATLSLVGGDLTVQPSSASLLPVRTPSLLAPGGQILLASVASPGEVGLPLTPQDPPVRLQFFPRLGQVQLTESRLDTSGPQGGAIVIRSGRLQIANSQVFADTHGPGDGAPVGLDLSATQDLLVTQGSLLTTDVLGAGRAGDIRLSADRLLSLSGASVVGSRALLETTGARGNISLDVGAILLTGGARIDTSTFGDGPGGMVTIQATDTILLAGEDTADSPSSIFSGSGGAGVAGQLVLTTPTLVLEEGARIDSSIAGNGDAGAIDIRVGRLSLTGGSAISSTSGFLATDGRPSVGAGQGGTVTITATDLVSIAGHDLTGQVASTVSIQTLGQGDAGRITIVTPRLTMQDGGLLSAATGGDGRGGEVSVQAGSVTLASGAHMTSTSGIPMGQTFLVGTGAGGMATVTAQETLTIGGRSATGMASALSTETRGPGPGGAVVIDANRLLVTEGGEIGSTPFGTGRGGTVMISAGTLDMHGGTIHTASGAVSDVSAITVVAEQVTLTDGARIDSSTFGAGRGGTISLTARDTLTIGGQSSTGGASGLFSDTRGERVAGAVEVQAGRLIVHTGGVISSGTEGPGPGGTVTIRATTLEMPGGSLQARSAAGSTGNAGTIDLTVERATLILGVQIDSSTAGSGQGGRVTLTPMTPLTITGQNTGLSTRTAGTGVGGDIALQAPRVELRDGASISAESTGLGNAGNINITAHDSFVSTNSSVVTRATQADGGNIQITAPFMVCLCDSAITAEVGGGAATTIGGNVVIDPRFVLLQNGQIRANAVAGHGGNIHIRAGQVFLADPASLVSASSALGIDGQVALSRPRSPSLSGTLAPLAQAYARTPALLRNRCAERIRTGASRLLVGGRDGVPSDPWSGLASPMSQMGTATAREPQPGATPSPLPAWGETARRRPETGWTTLAMALDLECVHWRSRDRTLALRPR